MTEPRPIAEGLERARRALESATPPPSIRPDVFDEEDAAEIARIRTSGIDDLRRVRWSAMIPQRFYNATLDWTREEHGDEVGDRLDAWWKLAPRPNLVLFGPVGTGKTGAAIAAVRDDAVRCGLSVLFLPVVEMLDMLRPGGPPDAFETLVDVDRLILDDVGAERATDWTAERFYAVVNRRWLEERPTIATTNLPPAELEETVGARLFSRLVGSDAVSVTLAGRDRRRSTRG